MSLFRKFSIMSLPEMSFGIGSVCTERGQEEGLLYACYSIVKLEFDLKQIATQAFSTVS